VAVGSGVGVAVGSGLGVTVGSGLGVAVGSGLGGSVTSNVAVTTAAALCFHLAPRPPDETAPPTACGPSDAGGTWNEVLNVPSRVAFASTRLVAPLSHVNRTLADRGKPLPLARIVEPGAPDKGDRVRMGLDAADNGPLSGIKNDPMTTSMVRRLTPTSQPLCCRGGVGGFSSTHLVPSQKANLLLRSATRLTQGVPWLCGPASRRVCYFVGGGTADAGYAVEHLVRLSPQP
jgi:hypothetical protein